MHRILGRASSSGNVQCNRAMGRAEYTCVTDDAHQQPLFPGTMMLIALIALVAAGRAVLYDTLDPDCFWHLRVADQLCEQGIGPLVDDISFSSIRTPWTP